MTMFLDKTLKGCDDAIITKWSLFFALKNKYFVISNCNQRMDWKIASIKGNTDAKEKVDLFLLILISTSKIEVIKCDIMILRLGTSNQTQIEPNLAALNVYIIIY